MQTNTTRLIEFRTQLTRKEFIEGDYPGKHLMDKDDLSKRARDMIVELLAIPRTWDDVHFYAKPGKNAGRGTVLQVRAWLSGGRKTAKEVSRGWT